MATDMSDAYRRQAPTDAAVGDALRYLVFVHGSGLPHAVCGCGWVGRKRLTGAGARLDAWLHAARARHMLASPFIL